MKPRALVLRAAGINCDREAHHALELAGAAPETVHINEFTRGHRRLGEFRLLVIPGGFTYGDDVSAGKILANEMRALMGEQVQEFIASGGLALGICNGFQVLVKAGLLPGALHGAGPDSWRQETTLADNLNGRFQCRWVHLKVNEGASPTFLRGMEGLVLDVPIAHGEGRFTAPAEQLQEVEKNQVAFRYCGPGGELEDRYNVNGSALHAAGISGFGGRVLGLMPHPERYVYGIQHPQWTRRGAEPEGQGLRMFRNAVEYLRSR